MSAVLEKLAKLIDRAVRPTRDDDDEARNAAMAACAVIRKHNLYVYDPKDTAPTADVRPAAGPIVNPVVAAMKKRREERERLAVQRRARAPHVVG